MNKWANKKLRSWWSNKWANKVLHFCWSNLSQFHNPHCTVNLRHTRIWEVWSNTFVISDFTAMRLAVLCGSRDSTHTMCCQMRQMRVQRVSEHGLGSITQTVPNLILPSELHQTIVWTKWTSQSTTRAPNRVVFVSVTGPCDDQYIVLI